MTSKSTETVLLPMILVRSQIKKYARRRDRQDYMGRIK